MAKTPVGLGSVAPCGPWLCCALWASALLCPVGLGSVVPCRPRLCCALRVSVAPCGSLRKLLITDPQGTCGDFKFFHRWHFSYQVPPVTFCHECHRRLKQGTTNRQGESPAVRGTWARKLEASGGYLELRKEVDGMAMSDDRHQQLKQGRGVTEKRIRRFVEQMVANLQPSRSSPDGMPWAVWDFLGMFGKLWDNFRNIPRGKCFDLRII